MLSPRLMLLGSRAAAQSAKKTRLWAPGCVTAESLGTSAVVSDSNEKKEETRPSRLRRKAPARAVMEQTKLAIKKMFTMPDMRQRFPVHEVFADFADAEEAPEWAVFTDGQIGGYSRASFEHADNGGYSTFSGVLSTKLPERDRKAIRSGFCILRSPGCVPTLVGESYIDFGGANGLELEIRGDGRTYTLNIQTESLQQEDLFQAPLFTRGGPLWTRVQVPFCDFLLTSMGFIQNEQTAFDETKLRHLGIGLADEIDGPFKLDVKYIKPIRMRKEVTNLDLPPNSK